MSAIAAAIALHVGLLTFRPVVSGGQASATRTASLAVRMVYPVPANSMALTDAKSAVPPLSLLADQESSAALLPRLQTGLERESPQEHQDHHQAAGSQIRADSAAPVSHVLDVAHDYALGAALNPGPRSLDDIDPDYPDPIRLRSGTVVLRLLISDTGHVDDVTVVRAGEPEGVFEQAAIEAFSKARFAPGMAGGVPVKSQIRVEVEFMPINRGARISGRSY